MTHLWSGIKGQRAQSYERLPLSEKELTDSTPAKPSKPVRFFAAALLVSSLTLLPSTHAAPVASNKSCDSINEGYRCSPEITRFWGQYSLWFSVPSDIDVAPPQGCDVSFASVLSRHGGRDPTANKGIAYGGLIGYIQSSNATFTDEFAFLKDYKYTLGSDQLTDAGRQELVNSGAHFYRRYSSFLDNHTPFVRSSGQDRVVESAEKWLVGYAQEGKKNATGKIDVTISEGEGMNNTLSHEICTDFEDGPISDFGHDAQDIWESKFVPPIQARVNAKLGMNLTTAETIYLMDMCSFDTLASPTATVSDFCYLFTEDEWHQYDYYETLGKYYGHGNGNPLGPTQGVGYVNELIARLTEQPVNDHTNTNSTLDSDPATFPLDRKAYADFSHDNDMSSIFSALGLYNTTEPLSNSTVQGTDETNGFSASWTVPFAARMYVEKLACGGEEDFVRIIVNDRVIPLEFCGGDEDGKCTLSKFVESQSFARGGGHWDQCYV
ncbi:acid phosphatase [Massarina eburnea CBS 473.64]|uniref:Phytase A n=1 Tax=Massarina eburnea CBS 473.64 TaxID=1395130 RepID=A0A6A6S442_9PLEO|nr:acid phosphatase [Massarina eburnea CBS 473.64]